MSRVNVELKTDLSLESITGADVNIATEDRCVFIRRVSFKSNINSIHLPLYSPVYTIDHPTIRNTAKYRWFLLSGRVNNTAKYMCN